MLMLDREPFEISTLNVGDTLCLRFCYHGRIVESPLRLKEVETSALKGTWIWHLDKGEPRNPIK